MIKNTKRFVHYFWYQFRRQNNLHQKVNYECLVCEKNLSGKICYRAWFINPHGLHLCVGCYKKIEYDLGLSDYEKRFKNEEL